jgi:hypothetical protein
MSCYFRHIKDIFDFAGIEVTAKNKKDIDRIIHELVAVDYKDCPKAWKALKAEITSRQGGREAFARKLKAKLGT